MDIKVATLMYPAIIPNTIAQHATEQPTPTPTAPTAPAAPIIPVVQASTVNTRNRTRLEKYEYSRFTLKINS